jgi:leucyl-tRNA synthetase
MTEHSRDPRPAEERSDWTDQDLLTIEEALPRLEAAIAELTSEVNATTDPRSRTELERRLNAMAATRERLTDHRRQRAGL